MRPHRGVSLLLIAWACGGVAVLFSQAIVRLLSDPGYAGRLGRAAWQTVQDRYSAERVTQLYLELFSSLQPGPTLEDTRR